MIEVSFKDLKTIVVRARSTMKPKLWAEQEVIVQRHDTPLSLAKRVEAAGGAVCEHLCLTYGDQYTPSDYAVQAVKAFKKELLTIGRLSQPLKEKLYMIEQRKSQLNEQERELLDRVTHAVNNGAKINPNTLDDIIRRLYENN